jgi:hypothetical protein
VIGSDAELKACLFPAKSYNAHVRVMQKDAGLRLVLFIGTRRIQGRQTMPAPVPSPCNLFFRRMTQLSSTSSVLGVKFNLEK